MHENYHDLFPIHARSLPGMFLRIASCHDTRVSIYAPRDFQTAALGDKYFLFFLEIARDCRKTSTWVTYGNVQTQPRMRMRRKEYVVIKKNAARAVLPAERELSPI